MSSEKFTPGEWIRKEKNGYCDIEKYNGMTICRVDYDSDDSREDEANAHLIAAAPEMYRELNRRCILCQLADHETECDLCPIGDILKKARGED